MSLALYRKYRPRTFSDIYGQEAAMTVLKNAAARDRIAHAYLFCGIRGTGKTTAARLVAKTANCYTRLKDESFKKQGEPCNDCDACISIDEGGTIDIMEIDAASNRGIDEIRNIKEAAQFAPSYFQYKVFIIDEAHALTKDASNALLKLLEEPPGHAIFILATTEPEKLLPTITSRTQRFDFRKLTPTLIQEKLEYIANQEGLNIESAALHTIALSAEGSLRDAESMLDQIASFELETIKLETVEEILGRVGLSKLKRFVDAILENKAEDILNILENFNEQGINPSDFSRDLLRYLRRILALNISPNLKDRYARSFSDEEINWFSDQAKKVDVSYVAQMIKALLEAQRFIRHTTTPMLPIEAAIISTIEEYGNKS